MDRDQSFVCVYGAASLPLELLSLCDTGIEYLWSTIHTLKQFKCLKYLFFALKPMRSVRSLGMPILQGTTRSINHSFSHARLMRSH